MKTVAPLRYGVIFKKAFSRPEIFSAFVRDILGIEFQIDHVETEKSFAHPIGSVDSRFDLFAEDKVNRVIVDIQHRRYLDHYHRFLHYHCAALLEQIVNSKDYRPPLAVYTIVILTSGDRHQKDMLAIDFDPKDWDGVGIQEIPHKILFISPKYLSDRTPEPWREWMRAIEDSLDEQVNEADYHNICVQQVLKLIEQDQITPAEYARMKDEYSEEQLRLKEWKEALDKSRLLGVEEGKQLGLEEGELRGRLKTAQTMLSKSMPLALVADLTGLSPEQLHDFIQ